MQLPRMKQAARVGGIALVSGSMTFCLVAHVFAQLAPVTCQSIAGATLNGTATFDLIADFPSKATKISEQILTRTPTAPGAPANPWVPCSFGATCQGVTFGSSRVRTDGDDGAETWTVHVANGCAVPGNTSFCGTTYARLVLTYSFVPTTSQCFSQSTFEIGSGTDHELTLYAPAPARSLSWGGWMREETAGSHWQICDVKDFGHMCWNKAFNFSQMHSVARDDADMAQGVFFSCTDKIVNIGGSVNGTPVYTTVNGPTRWCRAQVAYEPNSW